MFCGIYELNFFWWLVYNNEFKMFVFEKNRSEVDLIIILKMIKILFILYDLIKKIIILISKKYVNIFSYYLWIYICI